MEEKNTEIFSYLQVYQFYPGIYIGNNKYILKRLNDIILYDITSNRFKKLIYDVSFYNILNKSLDNKIIILSNYNNIIFFHIENMQYISILYYEKFLTASLYKNKKNENIIISLSIGKFYVWNFNTYEIILEKELQNVFAVEILNIVETKEYFIYLNKYEKHLFSINKNNFAINFFEINFSPFSICYFNEENFLISSYEKISVFNINLQKEVSNFKNEGYLEKNNKIIIENYIVNINNSGKIILIQKNKIYLYEFIDHNFTLKNIFLLNGLYINYLYDNFIVTENKEKEQMIEKINL